MIAVFMHDVGSATAKRLAELVNKAAGDRYATVRRNRCSHKYNYQEFSCASTLTGFLCVQLSVSWDTVCVGGNAAASMAMSENDDVYNPLKQEKLILRMGARICGTRKTKKTYFFTTNNKTDTEHEQGQSLFHRRNYVWERLRKCTRQVYNEPENEIPRDSVRISSIRALLFYVRRKSRNPQS
jgi:hypothetical protein